MSPNIIPKNRERFQKLKPQKQSSDSKQQAELIDKQARHYVHRSVRDFSHDLCPHCFSKYILLNTLLPEHTYVTFESFLKHTHIELHNCLKISFFYSKDI